MTALALDLANRSATVLGIYLDALNKAIEMAKAIHPHSPSESDIQKIKAIADTI